MKKNVKKEKIICSIVFVCIFLFLAYMLYEMKHFIISGPGFRNECTCYPSDKLIDNLGTIGNIIWVMSPLVGLIVL